MPAALHGTGRVRQDIVALLEGLGRDRHDNPNNWLQRRNCGAQRRFLHHLGYACTAETTAKATCNLWHDVGGCDKIRPLWRHYFQQTEGIVFFVDSNDYDRLDEVRSELQRLMAAPELQDVFCLVIASKQDLPRAMSPAEVSKRMQLVETLGSRMWICLPGSLGDAKLLKAHFDWLASAVRHARAHKAAVKPNIDGNSSGAATVPGTGGSTGIKAANPDATSTSSGTSESAGAATGGSGTAAGSSGQEPDILERWLQVEDEPDDEFLQKLEDYSLQSWDHRTHLRLAWLYLRRHGRREGLVRIRTSIRAFIEHSPLTRRKTGTTYHETMTYFWSHMVHFAMESMKVPVGATSDFRLFLLLNPQLSNGGLFLHYYSKRLMLESPEARVQVVLPDKRPLPSIISDISALSLKQEARGATPPPTSAAPLSDTEFLRRFLSRTLDRWNHECLLRGIYCCLKRHGRRRGGNVALEALRELQKDGFHLTINYFWVCMLTHTLVDEYATALFADRNEVEEEASGSEASVPVASPVMGRGDGEVSGDAGAGKESAQQQAGAQLPEWPVLLQGRGYTSVRLKELVADEQKFLKFYSKQVIFSEAAAAQFVPPDKRPLPSTAGGGVR